MKNLLKNLALSGFVLLLCAGGLEFALRVAGYGNLEIYDPDPLLFWRLRPNQDAFTKIDHKPVHVNAHGTRGPEFADAKPAGTIRILSLGDSRTFGWGVSDAESYSGRLESLLQQRAGEGERVEVINAGVNAWSFPQLLVFFREIGSAWHPDFAIVGEANLWTQFSEKSSPEFRDRFMFRVRLKNLLRRLATYHYVVEVKLKDLYERERVRFIPVDPQSDELFKDQQQDDPERFFRESIEQLCRTAIEKGTKPILLYIPTLSELESGKPSRSLKAKREVAARLGVPLVDPSEALRRGGASLYLEGDPVHLSVEGNEVVAKSLFDAITPMVGRPG